jgi:hypothetical protein
MNTDFLPLVVPAQAGTHNTVPLATPYGFPPARESQRWGKSALICEICGKKLFALHRGITASGSGNVFSRTSRASTSAGVVRACTHSAVISAPRFSINATSRSPTGCGTTTNGSVRWPMPSAVTCASGANAALTTVMVGTPSASSSAASRAVHGVDEPQWPTPLITASQPAAIAFA